MELIVYLNASKNEESISLKQIPVYINSFTSKIVERTQAPAYNTHTDR